MNRLLDNHVLPSLESRRVNTFSPTVADDFIQAMEERSTGLFRVYGGGCGQPCIRSGSSPEA